MTASAPVAGRPSWHTLVAALAWRTRREGLRYLLFPVIPFVLVMAINVVLPIVTGSGQLNGAASLASFARRFGADTDAAAVGAVLLIGPGMVAVCCSLAGGITVRTLVGAEASRGGLEAILAAAADARSLVKAVLVFAFGLVTAVWAALEVLAVACLAIVAVVHHAQLTITAPYVALLGALPLITAWCGTALSAALTLLVPRLAQQGQMGFAGGSNLASGIALLPGLAVLLLVLLGGPHLSVAGLVGWALLVTAAVTVTGVLSVSRWFRVQTVLES